MDGINYWTKEIQWAKVITNRATCTIVRSYKTIVSSH